MRTIAMKGAPSSLTARSRAFLVGAALAACALPCKAWAQIQVSFDSNAVVITWGRSNADLEEADAPAGPWRLVTGATSPYRVINMLAPKFYRLAIVRPPDNPRTRDVPPLRAIEAAVADFKAADPDASFSYFNGHVDGFATRPRKALPAYASYVLASVGLPLVTREPIFLGSPLHTDTHPKPARDRDADFDIALPTLPESDTG